MTELLHNLLEQHFDTAFAAPDGIKKLRELILTLAMQGKLVAQDPNDPPASELLKQIEAEKQRRYTSSSSRKRGSNGKKDLDSRLRGNDGIRIKPLPPIKPEEVPYELPQGWEWVRLGDIAQHNSGKTLDKARNTGQPRDYITTSNLYWGRFELDNVRQMLIKDGELEKCTAKKNDLLICEGGEAGRAAVWSFDSEVCFQNHVHRARFYKDISPYFVYRYFEKLSVTGEINRHRKGVGISNMSSTALASIVTPLPPLPEQHRIVAKIDQLMAKCDELEALRKEREEKRRAVHAAAIKRLLDTSTSFPRRRESSSSEELDLCSLSAREQTYGGDGVTAHGWNFIQKHFGELYTVKENVAELRKTILQLAVMGRLVPQDPNDPPASELLKQIEAEKQRLVKSGKIKQPKLLSPIKPEEVPYELPQGWEWVRLGDITINRDGERIPVSKNERGKIKGEYDYYGASGVIDKVNDYIFDKSLLLIGEDGANLINRSTPIAFIAHGKYWVNNHAHVIDAHNYALLLWLEKYINAIDLRPYVTGSAQPKMNQAKMNSIPVALPPLPEQHRIVTKVDQLMTLCDQLEEQIDAASTKQRELLDAVMSSVS